MTIQEAVERGLERGRLIYSRERIKMQFLNSEQAKAEEEAARELQQATAILDALEKIAALELKVLVMSETIGEMALENALLKVEIKLCKQLPQTPGFTES